MKRFSVLLAVVALGGVLWVGIALSFMRPIIGVPMIAVSVAAILLWARHDDRKHRPVAAPPAGIEWRVFDEPLPDELSETELAMRARYGGPDEAFWHNTKVYSDLPWTGTPGVPQQRNGDLN